MTTIVKYTDARSAYDDSHVDLALGFVHGQVGLGRSIGSKFPMTVVVNDQQGWAYVAIVTHQIPATDAVWKTKPGGEPWAFVYAATAVGGLQQVGKFDNQWSKREDKDALLERMLRKTQQ